MSVQRDTPGTQPEVLNDGGVGVKVGEDVEDRFDLQVWQLIIGLCGAVIMLFISHFLSMEHGVRGGSILLWTSGFVVMFVFLPAFAINWYRYGWAGQSVWWVLRNGGVHLQPMNFKEYPKDAEGLVVFVRARKYSPEVKFFWGAKGWHFVEDKGGQGRFVDYAQSRRIPGKDQEMLRSVGLTGGIQTLLVSSVDIFSHGAWRIETPCGGTLLRFVGQSSMGNSGIVITVAPHDFGLLQEIIIKLVSNGNYSRFRQSQRLALKKDETEIETSWAMLAQLAQDCFDRSYQKRKGDRANSRIRDIEQALTIYEYLAAHLPEGHISRSVHRGTAVLDAVDVVFKIRLALAELRAAKGKPEQQEEGATAPATTG